MTVGTSKLSSKGQITIPKSIRDRLNLVAGDELIIIGLENGEIIIRKPTLEDHVKEAEEAYQHRKTVSHEELFGR